MDATFWHTVIETQYRLPEDHNLLRLTDELLDCLASTDATLRDTFAYNILARWIVLYRYHSHSDLLAIADWLVAQMNTGLGDLDSDTVFLRSYSVAVLALIMYRDSQEQFMDALDVNVILDKARQYLVAERDHRVYVHGKGWANAIPNVADLLKFLAYNTALEPDNLFGMLQSITEKMVDVTPMPFLHDEEDRLARVVIAVLGRDRLTLAQWQAWIHSFVEWQTDNRPSVEYDPVYAATHQNIKHFLRSLLVQMQTMPKAPAMTEKLHPELQNAVRAFLP